MSLELSEYRVVLLGCGRMGTALVGGAVRSGSIDGSRLCCLDTDRDRAARVAAEFGATVEMPTEGPRLIIVAVKPDQVRGAVMALDLHDDDVVLSVAAGLSAKQVQDWVGVGPRVVRCMPNTPSLVGAGVTGVHFGHSRVSAIFEFLSGVGEVVELPKESDFDALTAISGSGPAYIFTAIEALADGGVLMGLSRKIATRLAIHTVIGAGRLAAESNEHTAALKDAVASPGGTTIAGLEALENAGFRAALIAGVRASAERSRELGEKLS